MSRAALESDPPSSTLVLDPPQLERNELGQVVFPAKAPPPAVQAPYASEWTLQQEAYLRERGWELVSRSELGVGRWRDPKSAGDGRGIRTHVGNLPKKDAKGVTEPLYQVVCPPGRWDMHTGDAVAMQRTRDEGGEREPTPLERLDAQAAQLTRLLGSNVAMANELAALVDRKIPERPENQLAELKRLRQAVLTASEKLKETAEAP